MNSGLRSHRNTAYREELCPISTSGSGTEKDIDSSYEDGAYLAQNPDWHAGDSLWKARQVMELLNIHHLNPEKVCEIGCGAGEILVALQRAMPEKTEFFGYEISSQAFALCSPKANERLQFVHGGLPSEHTGSFDLLLALDVIEHVEDYLGFLRRIRNKAEYKLFHIPLELTVHSLLRNVLMLNRRALYHLHHFSKDTAIASLQHCGYEIVDWVYTPAVIDAARPGLKSAIANMIRKTGFRANADKSVIVFGGYSMAVLAR